MKLKVNWKALMKQFWTAEVKVLGEGERMNFASGKFPHKGKFRSSPSSLTFT